MDNLDPAMIGFALFVISEIIGMSRMKDNSLLQFILRAAVRAFPYEIRRTNDEPEAPSLNPFKQKKDDRKDFRRRRD